jgi:hypothetical protein
MPLLPLFLAGRLLAAVMVALFRLLRFAVQHRGRMPLLPLFLAGRLLAAVMVVLFRLLRFAI